jgi:hypothetical protein
VEVYDLKSSAKMIRSFGAENMLKRCTQRFVWGEVILCLVSLTPLLSQDEPKEAKKPDLIEVQVKVTDRRTGNAIDNADVQVNWGQRSDTPSATTNSRGIARLTEVPRGKVAISVVASGYKVGILKSVDLKKEGQPIKIELDEEPRGPHGDDKEVPPRINLTSLNEQCSECAPQLKFGSPRRCVMRLQ